jgi:hypothetical protein
LWRVFLFLSSDPSDKHPPDAIPDCRHGPVKVIREALQTLLKLLAEWEREELKHVMQ